jgi:hypothetical protein
MPCFPFPAVVKSSNVSAPVTISHRCDF